MGDPLREGTAKRERVDAAMGVEPLVLVGEQKFYQARIDVLARRRQSPAALRRGVGAQQLAVAVDHHRGESNSLPEWRRPE